MISKITVDFVCVSYLSYNYSIIQTYTSKSPRGIRYTMIRWMDTQITVISYRLDDKKASVSTRKVEYMSPNISKKDP